jgi:uncharacterized membrane protein YfcA
MVGALCGALSLVSSAPEVVRRLIGVTFMAMLVLLLWRPGIGTEEPAQNALAPLRRLAGGFAFLLNGFWTGFFSAGAHVFGSYILIMVFRRTFLEAAGILKVEGLAAGAVSIAVFAWNGLIDWPLAMVLFCGTAIGADIGSRYGLRKGNAWVRALFVAIVLITSAVMLMP